jgi:hypothetical protein
MVKLEVDRAEARKLPRSRAVVASVLVFAAGSAIAWIDTRPGWDDTGVSAGALMIAAGAGAAAGVPFWLAAALAAGPVVAAEISRGYGVLLAIPVAVLAACTGLLVRRITRGRARGPHDVNGR